MTDIVFRLQALIPATQDMGSTDAAETIEEACDEIFKLRGLLTEARRERDEARAKALEEARAIVDHAMPADPSEGDADSVRVCERIMDDIDKRIGELKDRAP